TGCPTWWCSSATRRCRTASATRTSSRRRSRPPRRPSRRCAVQVDAPADGYLLARRYRLLQRLGEGGAGTVWRARDEMLNREVAVKQVRVPPQLTPAERAEFADRALYAARAAGRLREPALVLSHYVHLECGLPSLRLDMVTSR